MGWRGLWQPRSATEPDSYGHHSEGLWVSEHPQSFAVLFGAAVAVLFGAAVKQAIGVAEQMSQHG
jgi:hypothetical protein